MLIEISDRAHVAHATLTHIHLSCLGSRSASSGRITEPARLPPQRVSATNQLITFLNRPMNIIINFLPLIAFAAALVLYFMLFRAVKPNNTPYQYAVALALAAAFLLFWLVGAVGIIGSAGDDANLMYAGVLTVGMIGAIIVRFEPQGMARALFATALAQALVTGVAVSAGLGYPASPPLELLILNGFFAALWVGSALLFRKAAAREQLPAGAEPASKPTED